MMEGASMAMIDFCFQWFCKKISMIVIDIFQEFIEMFEGHRLKMCNFEVIYKLN